MVQADCLWLLLQRVVIDPRHGLGFVACRRLRADCSSGYDIASQVTRITCGAFNMRRRGRVGAVMLLLVLVAGCGYRPRVSSTVTADRIRQVSPGMSKSDVVAILGPPLRERHADNTGGVLLDYAIDGVALRSFDFWIALDSHDTVNTVRVEESPLVADSYAIYDARPKLPVYEHPEFARMIGAQK